MEFREQDSLSRLPDITALLHTLSGKEAERVGEKCRLRCVSYMLGDLSERVACEHFSSLL